MARTITDEEIKLSIIINGNPAQKQLLDLEKATRKLTEETNALVIERRRLEVQGKKDTDQYKALTATINANNTAIQNNKAVMKELQNQIGITSLSIGQLREKANQLRYTLKNLTPDSADFKKFDAELKQVNARLGELTGKAQASKFSISSIADGFNKYQALAVSVIATITGVVLSIQKIIDYNGKLSDAQADVMKTTRMTKEEVDELTKSFGLLKTRTQRIELLGIAKVAGELNIAKSEVGDFVKVMDKAGVSLGDSFEGGAEEVATKLGKIKTLYDELKDAKVELAFESVGSALNDLGADGNATAQNISDFVTRVGTLSAGLKPTISEALGLGAAFEETGLNAEIAGNNYGKLLRIAARDTPKFAQFMKMTNEEATKLINTDPTEFFLKFTQAFGNIKDATKQASLLDSLKLNDNEVGMVISAAAKNTDLFRQKIDLANDSLNKGTSMTDEFNIKNSNLAATLEKIKKTTSGWFSSDTFVKWLTSAVNVLANFIGASDDADGSAKRLRDRFIFMIKIIAIVVTSYISYNAAVKLTALWTNGLAAATQILNAIQNRGAVVSGLLRSSQLLLAASYYTITGNTVRATAAMRLFNASASANPLGLVLLAITAVVGALVLFNKETSKATKLQQLQADIQNEVAKSISKEKNEVEALVKIAQDETISKEKKLAAIKRLNEISPEYLKGLTLENIKTLEGKKLLDSYIDSLYKKARAIAVANKLQKLEEDKLDIEKKTSGDFRKEQTFGFLSSDEYDKAGSRKELEKIIQKKYAGTSKEWQKRYLEQIISRTGLLDKEKLIDEINSEINSLKPEFEKNLAESIVKKVEPVTTDDTTGGIPDKKTGGPKNPNSSQADIDKLKLDDKNKFDAEYLRLVRQLEDDKIAAMQEGYQKELAIENLRYEREIEDLERQKINAEDMAKLDVDIAKAKESGDISRYNALLIIKEGYAERNKKLEDKINEVIEGKRSIHFYKLSTIEEKAAKDSINKSKQKFEADKVLRETKFQEQLAALGNNEKAKAKLKKEFEVSELAEEEKFLKELIDKFNVIVGKGKFENIDLSLLTPQQVEEFTAEAAKVGLTLAELIGKKNELAGKTEASNASLLGLNKGNTDILGFTQENWKKFYDNLKDGKFGVDEMIFAVSALTDMYAKYSSFVSANENRQLQQFEKSSDKKKTRLKRQLDAGYINQAQYDRQIKRIDDEVDKRKAELAYKQAKREKAIAIMSAITGTATAVIGALGNKPWTPFNFALAGIVGAMGALNIATIAKTPLPARGYEEGLYPVKREQDGKIFQSRFGGKTKSGLVTKPTYFLTGENGPEMIIDSRAYSKIHPAVKDALWNQLNGIKGWEQGMYNKTTQRFEVPAGSTPSSSNNTDRLLEMALVVIAENTAVMKDLRDKPIKALVDKDDKRSMKNIKEGVDDYNDFRNRNKF